MRTHCHPSIFSPSSPPLRGIRLQPPQLCPGLLALTIYWTNSKCSAWNESLTHPNKSTRGSGLKVVRIPHHGIPPSEFHPSMAWNKSHAILVRNLSAFFVCGLRQRRSASRKSNPTDLLTLAVAQHDLLQNVKEHTVLL